MIVKLIKIECGNIKDWQSFHAEFNRVFGFPDFYGKNMNAWIDCMSSLSCPDDGMTKIHCEMGNMITVELEGAKEFKVRNPELFNAITDGVAFVNWRLIETNEQPVLALSYNL